MTDYTPKPGSVVARAIAHLETLDAGAELSSSRLAEALGTSGMVIQPSLEPALNWGAIFRRRKDTAPRSPWFWSLTDHTKTPQKGANRDASAGQSHGAVGSENLTGRGTNGAPVLGAAPVFPMQASRAGPASDGSQKPNGAGPHSSTAPARAGSNTPRPDSQHVLKAEAARPDATDRENPATRSPVGGPMGAGQPAAAGPLDAPSDDFRIALWSDGVLDIRRPGGHLVRFTKAEARALVNYLEAISLDPLREEVPA